MKHRGVHPDIELDIHVFQATGESLTTGQFPSPQIGILDVFEQTPHLIELLDFHVILSKPLLEVIMGNCCSTPLHVDNLKNIPSSVTTQHLQCSLVVI